MFLTLSINDTIPATLLFDTGASASWALWENFATAHRMPFDAEKIRPRPDDNSRRATRLKEPLLVRLGATDLGHSMSLVMSNYISSSAGDGIFSPDYRTDKRIWELNFEHGYARIHERDTIPPHALAFPLTYNEAAGIHPLIEIHLTLVGKAGETFPLGNRRYILDTGTPLTVAFIRDFEKLAPFVKDQPSADNDFVTKGVLFNDRMLPTGRFTFWKGTPAHLYPADVAGALGVDFLKHFNVFLDLKHQRVYLQPHDRQWTRMQYSNLGCYFVRSADGQLRVGRVYQDSPAYQAGFRGAERIVGIDGVPSERIDEALVEKLYKTPESTMVSITIEEAGAPRTEAIRAYRHPLNFYN
jgi:hypothetical protein